MPQKKSSWRKAFERKARTAFLRQRIANLQRRIFETMQSTNPAQVLSGIEDQARRIGAGYSHLSDDGIRAAEDQARRIGAGHSIQIGPPPPTPQAMRQKRTRQLRQKLGRRVFPWWTRIQPSFMAPRWPPEHHIGPEMTYPSGFPARGPYRANPEVTDPAQYRSRTTFGWPWK